jgi:hypothetical protein
VARAAARTHDRSSRFDRRCLRNAVLAAILSTLDEGFLLLMRVDRASDPQAETMALSAFNSFNTGFLLAPVFFGAHLVPVGLLLYRSQFVPRVLSALLVAAGIGSIGDSFGHIVIANYARLASAVLLTPAVLGELGVMAWLLANGVDESWAPR